MNRPIDHTPHDAGDGLVRLSLAQLRALRLRHLLSGLDEAPEQPTRCGAPASLRGYTEWIGTDGTPVTLGWDWQFESGPGDARCVRVGQPFSNLVLVDDAGIEVDWSTNLRELAALIDGLSWSGVISEAVSSRYA